MKNGEKLTTAKEFKMIFKLYNLIFQCFQEKFNHKNNSQ